MQKDWLGRLIISGLVVGFVWLLWVGHKRTEEAGQEYIRKQEAERLERMACDRGEYCTSSEGWRRSSGKSSPVRLPTGEYYFQGHRCTQMCEGHIAGYAWARANEIINFDRCSTASPSFNAGCELGVIETRVKFNLE